MFKIMSAAVALFGIVAGAAAATQECLRPGEAEAEKAIRFQTKLMVVSETCREQTYPRFLHRNSKVLVDYQKRMIERYRRTGAPWPRASLDTYMTQLANQISLRVSEQPAEALCREQADFLATADALDAKKFRRYIAKQAVPSIAVATIDPDLRGSGGRRGSGLRRCGVGAGKQAARQQQRRQRVQPIGELRRHAGRRQRQPAGIGCRRHAAQAADEIEPRRQQRARPERSEAARHFRGLFRSAVGRSAARRVAPARDPLEHSREEGDVVARRPPHHDARRRYRSVRELGCCRTA